MYSLIIVDYNSIKNTIEYVLSCKESLGTLGASHIVILENGAFDGTLDELCSYFGNYETCEISEIEQKIYKFSNGFQEILYCFSGDNLGYAKGNNLAISIAASVWNDPYYIVSNNDLVFKDQIDLTLVDKIFKEDDSVGVIGPSIITPNGETQSPRRWQSATHRLILNYWILSLSGIFSERLRNKLFNSFANDTIIEAKSGVCAWVSGCFMFIRAEAFQKCNMFDENTFLYAEEMILAKRMEKIGYNINFLKELSLVHNHAVTTKKTIAMFKMVEIDFHANLYFYKNYTNTSAFVIFLAKISFKLLQLCSKVKKRCSKNSN